MSIKSGQTTGLIALTTATDVVIASPGAGQTFEFYNLVVHNTTTGSDVVDLFLSDDATSALAERIDRVTLGGDETGSFLPVGVPSGKYLIAKGTTDGAIHGEYIFRDGADA